MANLRNRWTLLLWPVVGLLLALGLRWVIIGQYDKIWRSGQGVIVEEELAFFLTFSDTSGCSWEELKQLARETAGGRLERFSGSSPDGARSSSEPTTAWSLEPDGFRRVSASRPWKGASDDGGWLLLTKRLAPLDRSVYRWTGWLLPIGAAIGWIASWLRLRRLQGLERYIRSLQSLRDQPQEARPREAMIEMFPEEPFSQGMNQELISLVETFLDKYSEIQTDAEQSQNVLAAMPVGILAFSPDLKLSFSNRAGVAMLDLGDSVRANSRLIEVIREPKVVELITESQRAGATMDAELERASPQAILRLRAYPLQLEPGHASPASKPPMLLVVTDETRLRQLESARRDFTANVSHELKTPLAAIKAYSETLLMGAIDDPEARGRFVQRIAEQASRLDSLIRDLLQLTKIQSLPSRLERTSLVLCDLIRTVADAHQPIAASRNIAIVNHADQESLRVLGEHEAVRTILDNLLSNAIRYSHPGSEVTIRAEAWDGMIAVSVSDHGIGIPESDLERIFERFFRVDKARSQDAGGTGLGLAIVKYLVAALGGRIEVKSQIGKGSRFTVYLERASSGVPGPFGSGEGLKA